MVYLGNRHLHTAAVHSFCSMKGSSSAYHQRCWLSGARLLHCSHDGVSSSKLTTMYTPAHDQKYRDSGDFKQVKHYVSEQFVRAHLEACQRLAIIIEQADNMQLARFSNSGHLTYLV